MTIPALTSIHISFFNFVFAPRFNLFRAHRSHLLNEAQFWPLSAWCKHMCFEGGNGFPLVNWITTTGNRELLGWLLVQVQLHSQSPARTLRAKGSG